MREIGLNSSAPASFNLLVSFRWDVHSYNIVSRLLHNLIAPTSYLGVTHSQQGHSTWLPIIVLSIWLPKRNWSCNSLSSDDTQEHPKQEINIEEGPDSPKRNNKEGSRQSHNRWLPPGCYKRILEILFDVGVSSDHHPCWESKRNEDPNGKSGIVLVCPSKIKSKTMAPIAKVKNPIGIAQTTSFFIHVRHVFSFSHVKGQYWRRSLYTQLPRSRLLTIERRVKEGFDRL